MQSDCTPGGSCRDTIRSMQKSSKSTLLDFCIERMVSRQEPPGVQSLCIKLAYQLTRSIPELQQELRTMLEIMEPELLVPAIRSVRKNTLEAIKAKKN